MKEHCEGGETKQRKHSANRSKKKSWRNFYLLIMEWMFIVLQGFHPFALWQFSSYSLGVPHHRFSHCFALHNRLAMRVVFLGFLRFVSCHRHIQFWHFFFNNLNGFSGTAFFTLTFTFLTFSFFPSLAYQKSSFSTCSSSVNCLPFI